MRDFKMLEKAPYDLPDARVFLELIVSSSKDIEKTYGPVYITRFIKNVSRFLVQKIGEELPKDIKDMNQVKEHLVSISNKYPTPYCAAIYAALKTENELMGKSEIASRVGTKDAAKVVLKGPRSGGRKLDVDNILSRFRKDTIALKIAHHEMGYKENEDGSIDLLWKNCFLIDVCQLAHNEGLLKRSDGTQLCEQMVASCNYFKLLTGYEWDYKLLEFGKSHCVTRCHVF
jgi:hypothetical protein